MHPEQTELGKTGNELARERAGLEVLRDHRQRLLAESRALAGRKRECEQQAWNETNTPGGSFWLLDFDPRDLDRQLSDY